jgi:cytochrome c peroxidase
MTRTCFIAMRCNPAARRVFPIGRFVSVREVWINRDRIRILPMRAIDGMGRGALVLLVVACLGLAASADQTIAPLASAGDGDPRRVALGERLFQDPILSSDNARACATCHVLSAGGDDGQALAAGRRGPLAFNTPTVFNAALSFRLNWRGNFRTLEEQAEAVLLDPDLMAMRWTELIGRLSADASYRGAFAATYGGAPSREAVLDALATFERSLLTPGARFDRFLAGETDAISREEEQGYQLFQSYGCAACHQGVNVGGNLFQRFGIFDEPQSRGDADLGRAALTGNPRDRRVFRVPSLRNVAVTAPYFHDGRAATLDQAVEEMARTQLGRAITEQDRGRIVAFLQTLTGRYQGRALDGALP